MFVNVHLAFFQSLLPPKILAQQSIFSRTVSIFCTLPLPMLTVFSFVYSLDNHFFYCQNKLESNETVNISNVTICFMIPSFQTLVSITCNIYFDNVMITCMHIRRFDVFFAFDWDLMPFSSPVVSYRVAHFQVCKICAFNPSNALVLIA